MPDAGESVRSDKENTFTEPQIIKKDNTRLLELYKPNSTAAQGGQLEFNLNDSAGNKTTYALIKGEVVTNTDTAEDGLLRINTMRAGTLTGSMKIDQAGAFYCGSSSQIKLQDTGLTGTRTFTFPDATQILVGINGPNDWGDTDQSFKDNRIRIWNPGNTFRTTLINAAVAADRNLTLPLLTADDTVVAEAFTQTLTNKTLDARLNTVPNIAVNPIDKRWGSCQPASGTTATTISNLDGVLGAHVGTGAGTNTVTFDTTEGVIANYVSTATGGLNIGLVSGTAGPICRRLFACKMSARVKIDSTTSARMYVGFCGGVLAISDTPIASGVPGVLVGFTGGATNFEIYSNDETGAMTTTAITGPIAKNANWHTIEINWAASGNVDVIFDGTTQTLSSQIPLTTSDLRFNCVGQTTTTTARTFSIHSVWMEFSK